MNESEFHKITDKLLESLLENIEDSDADACIEADIQDGVLTLELQDGQHYLVSKHVPSLQLWVSSPLSGGLHFAYSDGQWVLSDGKKMHDTIQEEIKTLTGISLS